MEHTKKFVFIPEDTLAKLNEKTKYLNERALVDRKGLVSSLRDNNAVLSTSSRKRRKQARTPPDIQAMEYSQHLQRYLNNKRNLNSPISLGLNIPASSPSTAPEVVSMLADLKGFQAAAIQKYNELLSRLQQQSEVTRGSEHTHEESSSYSLPQGPISPQDQSSPKGVYSPDIRDQFDDERHLARRTSIERDEIERETARLLVEQNKKKSASTRRRAPGARTKSVEAIVAQLTNEEVGALNRRVTRYGAIAPTTHLPTGWRHMSNKERKAYKDEVIKVLDTSRPSSSNQGGSGIRVWKRFYQYRK